MATTKAPSTKIRYRRDGKWWAASISAVPGAYAQGKTKLEVAENLVDAIVEIHRANEAAVRKVLRVRKPPSPKGLTEKD